MDQRTLLESLPDRLLPAVRNKIRRVWEWLSFGVLGLNSFIMLYYRSAHGDIQYVVCAGAAGYALVLLFQSVLHRHCPQRRIQIIKLSRKVFRLIYTAVYLTSIMLNIIAASQLPDKVPLMVYYGWLFVWAAIWGTNCFWGKKAYMIARSIIGQKENT